MCRNDSRLRCPGSSQPLRRRPVKSSALSPEAMRRARGRLSAMDADYPEHLLGREPAPPFDGEGPFAVWHFSEDPSLGRFTPQPTANPEARPLVWAVDT